MLYVTVELFRQHSYVNVENDSDEYLTHLLETAQTAVENDINGTIAGLADASGAIPKSIIHAIVLQAANLYENREVLAYGKIVARPYNYSYLIAPYIKLT
jgi:hypothetical protein